MKQSYVERMERGDNPILIEKVEVLSDDKNRGWFRFWTLETDETWYGSWYSTYEVILDKRLVLDLIFQDYIKTNFSGNGVLALRLYLEDKSLYEYQYISHIK